MTSQARSPGLIQRCRDALEAPTTPVARCRPTSNGYVGFYGSTRCAICASWGEAEINAFLSHLATEEGVSAFAQNHALAAQLLYGGGLRLMEALRLRIKDVDLEQRCITVRCGKGDKDRRTVLPSSLVEPLKRHMPDVRGVHWPDLAPAWGAVELPLPWRRNTGMRLGKGVAMSVSPGSMLAGSAAEHQGNAPSRSEPCAARRACSEDQQNVALLHPPPIVRQTPAGTGRRHPHDSGTVRIQLI
jgi:hypothetical protein